MIKLLTGIFIFASFVLSQPLSEVIKDIEVSGEMNYKYEHFSKKTSKNKEKSNKAKSAK